MSRWIEKKCTGGLGALLVLCLILGIAAAVYSAAPDALLNRVFWQQKWQYFDGTADVTLKVGDALAFHKTTGRIMKADADSSNGVSNFFIGLAGTNATKGQKVQVVRSGIISGMFVPQAASAGLTPYGAPVYLSNAEGGVTTAANITGVSQFAGHVLPMSEYAVRAGVTAGSDTLLINLPVSTGVSPIVTN